MHGVRVVEGIRDVIDEEIGQAVVEGTKSFDLVDGFVDFHAFDEREALVAEIIHMFKLGGIVGEEPLQGGGHQPASDLNFRRSEIAEVGGQTR